MSTTKDFLATISKHLEGKYSIFPPRRGNIVTNATLLEGGSALGNNVGNEEMFIT